MKTAINQNEQRAGVWMNHHLAHIVSRDAAGNYSIATIEPVDTSVRSSSKKKVSASEHARHSKEQQEQKTFFKTLHNSIKPFNHLLLCGPTTAKSEFLHYLKTCPSFAGKRVTEMSADIMTDRQLLAFMKKNLGKPMDIFREEEVL